MARHVMISSYKQISIRKIDKLISVFCFRFDLRIVPPGHDFERSISRDSQWGSSLETRFHSTNDLQDRPVCFPSELIKISRARCPLIMGIDDWISSPHFSLFLSRSIDPCPRSYRIKLGCISLWRSLVQQWLLSST